MSQILSQLLTWLPAIQMIASVLLIICVLLQNRGTDVGGAFGGSSAVYRTRRGIEKSLFRGTVALGIIFAVVSLARVILS